MDYEILYIAKVPSVETIGADGNSVMVTIRKIFNIKLVEYTL